MSYSQRNPNGQATKANSEPVVIASDDDIQSKLGIVTETAPSTDTASSGLNGRLQRIAQRLTTLIAQIPAVLGINTSANSLSVVLASDQASVPISTPNTSVSSTITAADAVVAAPGGAGALVSGSSTAGSLVAAQCQGGDSAWIIQLTGTLGGSTYYFEGSIDSTNGTDGNWININGRQMGVVNTALAANITVAGFYSGNTSGLKWIRLRAVGGSSITATVKILVSIGSGAAFLNASLPVGTNSIGKLAANSGVTIGDVNLVSAIPTGSNNIGNVAVSTVNSVAPAFGTGVRSASVQRVTVATDDVVPISDNSGSLTVDAPVGTPVFVRLSDGTSSIATLPVSLATGAGNVAKAEDVASADADVGIPAMVIRKATPANTSGTDGDYEMLQVNAGRLWTSSVIDTALPAGTNAIGKLVANSGVVIGDVNVASAPSNMSINNNQLAGTAIDVNSGNKSAGTQRVVLATDQPALTNKLLVTPDALPANQSVNCNQVAGTAVDVNSGTKSAGTQRIVIATDQPQLTNAFKVDGSAVTQPVAGDVAHGATNSGNPLQGGREAIAHGTNPTAVTAGQRTKLYANRAGVPFVMGGHPNIKTVRLQFTAAQTDVAIVTISTGTKIVVTALQVTLDNASTVFPLVRIGFGTANTPTTTGVIAAHGGVPAGGGFSRGDGSGIIGIGADDEDLRITTVGAATGNGVEVVVTYYTIES